MPTLIRWRNIRACRGHSVNRFTHPNSPDDIIRGRLAEDPNVTVGVIEAGLAHVDDPLVDTPSKGNIDPEIE
jgi:hypothetical protein